MVFPRALVGFVCLACSFAQPQPLSLNVPVQILLNSNHPASCQIFTQAGEYARVVVQPAGIPFKVWLLSPFGNPGDVLFK